MHPRIRELTDYLDRERADLDRAVASITADRHNEKPSDDVWCVAEVVNHLALTDKRVTMLLAKVTGEARAAGAAPDSATAPILPSVDVRKVLDRSQKIRNPRGDPPVGASVADGLTALDAARAELKKLLSQPDLPDLGKVSAPHPAFGPLSGYEWVAFMAAHTRRHADQIREIGGQLAR